MPQTNDIPGLEIFDTNSSGHATDMSFASAPFDTTTLRYAVAAIARDRSLSDVYTNTGTPASPVWSRIPKIASSFKQTIKTTSAMPLFGGAASPIGFSGTIVAVAGAAATGGSGTLTFAKNATTFAVITLQSSPVGVMISCPLGAATGAGSPLGSVTFGPTDAMTVTASVGTPAEVVVDFI